MRGVVIPMITPMNQDGTIDCNSLVNFTEYLLKTGVNCLYPNGTNGESLMLTKEERQQIAEVIVKTVDHRLPVVIQTGAMTTEETISHIQHAKKIGADGVGIMSPAFFPMDQEALYNYYKAAITEAGTQLPVYLYNIPSCTTNDVYPELLARIMTELPNVQGIKYSYPDLLRIEDYLLKAPRVPDVLIGCDSLFLQCLATGGVGTVTGPGAVFHERFTRLYRQFLEGDLNGSVETQWKIVKTDRAMNTIPGIPGLKTLLKLRGIIQHDTCREPIRALTANEYIKLENVLHEYFTEEGIDG